MQEVAISEFKAKCLALIERVCKTKRPLRITRFGRAIAEVFPPSPGAQTASWLGSMAGSLEITKDIVAPVVDPHDLEALR